MDDLDDDADQVAFAGGEFAEDVETVSHEGFGEGVLRDHILCKVVRNTVKLADAVEFYALTSWNIFLRPISSA